MLERYTGSGGGPFLGDQILAYCKDIALVLLSFVLDTRLALFLFRGRLKFEDFFDFLFDEKG